MRNEYEIDQTMSAIFVLSFYSGVNVSDLLEALSTVMFDENEIDYINKNWDVKSEG